MTLWTASCFRASGCGSAQLRHPGEQDPAGSAADLRDGRAGHRLRPVPGADHRGPFGSRLAVVNAKFDTGIPPHSPVRSVLVDACPPGHSDDPASERLTSPQAVRNELGNAGPHSGEPLVTRTEEVTWAPLEIPSSQQVSCPKPSDSGTLQPAGRYARDCMHPRCPGTCVSNQRPTPSLSGGCETVP